MNQTMKLPTGGTVRISNELWSDIQDLSVKLTIKKGRPIKESTIIHLLLVRAIDDCDTDELAAALVNE